MSWTYAGLKKNASGVGLIVALFVAVPVAMFALNPHKWENDASPIRSVDLVDATIRSVYLDDYKAYAVSPDNNSMVFINYDRPRLIGSRVKVERVTRQNGFVFYRFPE